MLTLLSLLALTCLGLVHFNLFPSLWELLPSWLGRLLQPVLYILPSLVIILSAVLLASALDLLRQSPPAGENNQTSTRKRTWKKGWQIFLAILLLLALAYVTFWESVWDQTSDGLGGIWLAFQASFAAVVCGGVLGIRAKSWHRSAGFAFALLVPIWLIGAFYTGWKVDYQALTQQRAARIAAAISNYQFREGHFPDSLHELVPKDLLWVPSQVILRQEDWCYQGVENAYVLGVYWRHYFSTPLEVKTYASSGCLVKSLEAACQSRLPALKQHYDPLLDVGEP
jgi:hypothetical protein